MIRYSVGDERAAMTAFIRESTVASVFCIDGPDPIVLSAHDEATARYIGVHMTVEKAEELVEKLTKAIEEAQS